MIGFINEDWRKWLNSEDGERWKETAIQRMADCQSLRMELERVSKAAAEMLVTARAFHDYCCGHPAEIRDVEDEIWLPFQKAIEELSKALTQSPPEPPASTSGTAGPGEAEPPLCGGDPQACDS